MVAWRVQVGLRLHLYETLAGAFLDLFIEICQLAYLILVRREVLNLAFRSLVATVCQALLLSRCLLVLS